jgi:hypothetical protein
MTYQEFLEKRKEIEKPCMECECNFNGVCNTSCDVQADVWDLEKEVT